MSAFVEEEESAPSAAGASAAQCVGVTTTNMPMPMVRCSAMSWTDTEAGHLRVLVARRDLVTCDTTMTEEQTVDSAWSARITPDCPRRSASWSVGGARGCSRRCSEGSLSAEPSFFLCASEAGILKNIPSDCPGPSLPCWLFKLNWHGIAQ